MLKLFFLTPGRTGGFVTLKQDKEISSVTITATELFFSILWRRHPDLNRGIKVLQTSALPLGYVAKKWSGRRDSNPRLSPWQGDTLPLSHSRVLHSHLAVLWCLRSESNQRHEDFQSSALPTELQRLIFGTQRRHKIYYAATLPCVPN